MKNGLPLIVLALLSLASSLVMFSHTQHASEKSPSHITLSSSNMIVLDTEVNNASVAASIMAARASKSCPVYLFLNTPGGSVPAGLEMIDALKGLDCPVKTVTRFAASMGFQLVQNLDERLMMGTGVLMSHHARGEFSGEYGGKQPAQVDSRLRLAVQQFAELDATTVMRTKGKQTLKSYLDAYSPELWLTAHQAVEQGYADRIVTVSCDDSLNGTKPMDSEFLGSQIKYEKANCPLITGPVNPAVNLHTTSGPMSYEEFLKKGGAFGSECLKSGKKLCAEDSTMNPAKLSEIREKFLRHYNESQNAVIPMYW